MAGDKQKRKAECTQIQSLSRSGPSEEHFDRASRVIKSWPAWKQGLVRDMSRSFAKDKCGSKD